MKIVVTDECISCGLCVETCPEVFEMPAGEKANAKANVVPPDVEDKAREARDVCPVEAIILED